MNGLEDFLPGAFEDACRMASVELGNRVRHIAPRWGSKNRGMEVVEAMIVSKASCGLSSLSLRIVNCLKPRKLK